MEQSLLDKSKILDFMTKRKDALYNHITRDFGGGIQGRLYEHSEVKIWKEAIERGEFDVDSSEMGSLTTNEVYIIISETQPNIVDFSFYVDRESVMERVRYLNSLADGKEYWYVTLHKNLRNP